MLKHLVLLKFKESVTKEQIEDLQKSLLSLPGKIKEIKEYQCGRDLRPTKTYDFALVAAFDNFEALRRYQVQPDHVNVLTKVRNLSSRIDAVDFEY